MQNRKGEGEKQVNKWKKAAVGAIAFVVILQCAVLCVVAANTGMVERSDERNTVLIDLYDGTTMDFVKEFPENLFLTGQETESPVVDTHWDVVSGGDSAGARYETLELTYAEKQLLARAVCVLGEDECAVCQQVLTECTECQQALVEVLLNRMLSEEFPDELKELVYGKDALCDVDLLNAAEVTETEYAVVTRAIYGPYLLNEDVTDFSYTCHK
ncbi:MAG: hypothetical protein IJZ34_02345 [Lachnospiraceae bacterium]|nr:hypothetical protein [Lachnospiraceae bacterium]